MPYAGGQLVNCRHCGEEFVSNGGGQKSCLTCIPNRAWATRFFTHGITKPQFDAKLEEQNFLCDLCGKPLPANITLIKIDHCHE